MKAVVCEMCGSTDLLKKDGVYVCQSCGTKYTLEEARKMMVEGTVSIKGKVQIDNTSDLSNLYQLARRARHSGDKAKALKYYDKVLEKDANNAEASFYSACYGALSDVESALISDIEEAANSICSFVEPYIRSLKESGLDEEKLTEEVSEAEDSAFLLCETYYNSVKDISLKSSYGAESAKDAIRNIVYKFGDCVLDILEDVETAVSAWMYGVETLASDKDELRETYIKKIASYQEGYVPIKSGCYIATAVYGSYDCPEVWTLRRFRDHTLMASILGRSFVRCYYKLSPTLVKLFGGTSMFTSCCRPLLDRFVKRLNAAGTPGTAYCDKIIK